MQSRFAGLGSQGGVDRESENYLRRLYRLTIGTRRGTNLLALAVTVRQSTIGSRNDRIGHVYRDGFTSKFPATFGVDAPKFRSALGERSINRLKDSCGVQIPACMPRYVKDEVFVHLKN